MTIKKFINRLRFAISTVFGKSSTSTPSITTIDVRTCSRCGKQSGDEDPDGNEVFFTKKYKQCNRCCKRNTRERSPRNRAMEVKKQFPVASDIAVYCIKEGNEIVYIGSSDKTSWRLYQHFQKNKSFEDGLSKMERSLRYSWSLMWTGDNINDAIHNEKVLIQIHQPKFNKIKYINYAA